MKKGLPGGIDLRSNVSLPPLARRFAGFASGAFDMNNGKPGIRFPAAGRTISYRFDETTAGTRDFEKDSKRIANRLSCSAPAQMSGLQNPIDCGTFSDMAHQVRNNLIDLFPRREIHTARWIIGSDAYAGQDYLFHTDYPAFFAKIGHSLKDGFLSRLAHVAGEDRCFYDFVWLDPLPDDVTFLNLMREAEDALKARHFE